MKTALRVNTDFTTEVLDLEAREYEQLSGAVGGLIQSVALLNGLEIVVNEEGKLIGLPVNLIGCNLWERAYGKTDMIVGDVVLTGGTDYESGETLPLSQAWLVQISELTGKFRQAYEGRVTVVAKDSGTKQCLQCGAIMERSEFTPKKVKSVTPRKTGGYRLHKETTGPTKVTWYCPEDFGHAIEE